MCVQSAPTTATTAPSLPLGSLYVRALAVTLATPTGAATAHARNVPQTVILAHGMLPQVSMGKAKIIYRYSAKRVRMLLNQVNETTV